MNNRCYSLALLAALSACAGGGNEDGRSDSRRGETGAIVELTGCVGASPGVGEIALRQVEFTGEDAARSVAAVPGITENAWVRVEGESIASMVGQRVRIRGEVIDSGRNTIGTRGVSGYETPSGDRSQADSDLHYAEKQQREAGRIARESLANGSSAKLRVLAVEAQGDCGSVPQAQPK